MKILSLSPASGNGYPPGIKRLDYVSAKDGVHDWALIMPEAPCALWIVVLHGHGARGDQLYTRQDIGQRWLPEFLATSAGIITLNLRGNAWMCPAAALDLHQVMEYLRAEHGMRKTIFCSGSMGGAGNLIYGVLYPNDVGAVVARGAASDLATYFSWCLTQSSPITHEIAVAIKTAYGTTPDQAPELFARHSALANADRLTMPVYLSHGAADQTIPVEQSRTLAQKMSGRKNFKYHEIPDGNHDSPLHDTKGLGWVLNLL